MTTRRDAAKGRPTADVRTSARAGAWRDEEGASFALIASLSVVVHVAVVAFAPSAQHAAAGAAIESQVVFAQSPAPPPPEPPPEPEPVPVAAPRAIAARAPAPPKPTVLEAATSTNDVAIDAVVGETASPVAVAPPPPPPIAAVAPAPTPAPAPAAVGPTTVPVKLLGRLPKAPALDRELERNYPTEARRAGIAGTAMLRVQVLPDGRLGRVEQLSESRPGFGPACERTVRAARWEPPLDRDGRAVATEIKYVCKFEVRS